MMGDCLMAKRKFFRIFAFMLMSFENCFCITFRIHGNDRDVNLLVPQAIHGHSLEVSCLGFLSLRILSYFEFQLRYPIATILQQHLIPPLYLLCIVYRSIYSQKPLVLFFKQIDNSLSTESHLVHHIAHIYMIICDNRCFFSHIYISSSWHSKFINQFRSLATLRSHITFSTFA